MITHTCGESASSTVYFVPEGQYWLEITKASEETSSNGNTQILLEVTVIFADGTEGPTFREYLTFTPKALFRVNGFLKAIGKYAGHGVAVAIECRRLLRLRFLANLITKQFDKKGGGKGTSNEIESFVDAEAQVPWPVAAASAAAGRPPERPVPAADCEY